MPLAPILKEILVCPKCKGDLQFHDGEGEAQEIHCLACRLAYRIEDGVPNLLISEARVLEPV